MGIFRLRRTWWLLGLAATAALGLIPLAHWLEPVREFLVWHGAAVGASGFLIAVIGFPLTIYAILAAQKAEEDAAERVEEAAASARQAAEDAEKQVAQTREDHRTTIEALVKENAHNREKLQVALFHRDIGRATRHIEAMRTAGQRRHWHPALLHCSEALQGVIEIINTCPVKPEPGQELVDARLTLEQIQTVIRQTRLGKNPPAGFEETQDDALTQAISLLANLASRVTAMLLE